MLSKKDITRDSYIIARSYPYVVAYKGKYMETPDNVQAKNLKEALEIYRKCKSWCEEVAMFKIENGIPYELRIKEAV